MKHYAVLNLDEGFDPFSNDEAFKIDHKQFTFLGGEPHIQILGVGDKDKEFIYDGHIIDIEDVTLIITQRYNTTDDIFAILQGVDAAKRLGFKSIELILPYFPGARQDRVCNVGEALTVKVFADLINGCGFDKVHIFCPHSDVTPALINNVSLIDLEKKFLKDIILDRGYENSPEINIVCPDAGAGKRVGGLAKFVSEEFPDLKVNLIRCEKERNVKTGELISFYVQASHLGNFPTIICDDLVARGGTFLGLGKELQKKFCGEHVLYTAHADCNSGLGTMGAFFDFVYTTNSKTDDTPGGVKNVTKLKITL